MVLLIDKGGCSQSAMWIKVLADLKECIKAVEWPIGSGKFTILPEKKANGVTPIKKAFQENLNKQEGWGLEKKLDLSTNKSPGKLDAVLNFDNKYCAVEWETGNISSSHRALNKMAVGLLTKRLACGVLILPTRNLYRYLTDRIGNFDEIEPYLSLWRSLDVDYGVLAILTVEYDNLDINVQPIPKGTDGRALR